VSSACRAVRNVSSCKLLMLLTRYLLSVFFVVRILAGPQQGRPFCRDKTDAFSLTTPRVKSSVSLELWMCLGGRRPCFWMRGLELYGVSCCHAALKSQKMHMRQDTALKSRTGGGSIERFAPVVCLGLTRDATAGMRPSTIRLAVVLMRWVT